MEYEELLEKAKKEQPKKAVEEGRFVMPTIKSHIQGNSTIISNFLQVATDLRRKPEHLLKYILKELATAGEIKSSGAAILKTKLSDCRLNEKLADYIKIFVLCKECKKPDTALAKEGRIFVLKCSACGAQYPVG